VRGFHIGSRALFNSLRQGGALSAIVAVCALAGSVQEVSAQTGALPTGWEARDIGMSGTGSTTSANGTWTVTGGGANIWDTADQFHFAYRAISGDLDIRARISAFDPPNEWAKAGVMVRDSLAGNARNAFMLVSPGIGHAFQQRTTTGGTTTRVSGGAGNAPTWVRIRRQGSQFTAYHSRDGVAWTTVSTTTISMPTSVYVGMAVTSRDSSSTAKATFTNLTVQGTASAAATPTWANRDIGSPTRAGTYSVSSGTFTVAGSGADIWGTADQFHFVYQPFLGDVEITARLGSLQMTNEWAKAGVMIRESLNRDSRHGFMMGTGANGWAFQRRIATAGESDHTSGPAGTAPGWVRLVREGNLLSAYRSADGTNWSLVGTDTVTMAQTVYVGLAVTSHNTSATATATFTNVTVRAPSSGSNQAPTVTLTSPAAGATYTAPATISLAAAASDPDGTVARVAFYSGSTLIATDTTSPFTASWSAAVAGTFGLRAVATDNEGGTTSSATVNVTVTGSGNQAPTVSFRSPSQSATFAAPAEILLEASASDSDGTVTRVDLYQGTTLLKADSTAPYSYRVRRVPAGSYQFRAVARDNDGATRTATVDVTVNAAGNQAPAVSLTSPGQNATFTAPATMLVAASATDPDGTVARVDLYQGTTLLKSDTTSPYSFDWTGVPAGSYQLTAVARDNDGATRTSTVVNVTVNGAGNQAPSVAITSPSSGATFIAPASLTIAASASDADGTIARVDFYVGSLLIATDTSSPYSAAWSSVASGIYTLTAVARDNGGATRTSAAITVNVSATSTRPTSVSFNASADHSTVTSYTVALYRSIDPVTASPVATRDLGKPTPVSGVITVDISTTVNPLPAGTYYAVVRAVGTGGTSASTPSATFTK
jgi:regulation of enolase protein 1 (concanavalin A-like superfamily)